MQIIPTTGLKKDFEETELRINQVKNTSEWIQVDVCDGIFAPGKTFELELLKKINFGTDNILWDIHLMVKNPENWINKCAFVGANRIIGQVEMMEDRDRFISYIKDQGIETGLAFDIETEVDNIPKDTDIILLMGRKAGFGIYPFDEIVIKKIEALRQIQSKFKIAVDGGVNIDNFKLLEKAGVNIVYSEISYFELNDKNR